MKRFIINVDEMPEIITARDLNEAVEIAQQNIDVHEINSAGEIID